MGGAGEPPSSSHRGQVPPRGGDPMTIDELLGGRILDLQLQRFKAIEASFEEGGWQTARHLELIPGGGAGLLREDERAAAAKAEIQASKLRDSLAKLKKSK